MAVALGPAFPDLNTGDQRIASEDNDTRSVVRETLSGSENGIGTNVLGELERQNKMEIKMSYVQLESATTQHKWHWRC
jgi:hypothetical protein